MVPDLQSLRLGFKRAFTNYYLALRSPGIADPTESFAAAYEYLSALRLQLGEKEFMYRLDDETIHLAGQVEQDLRHKARRNASFSFATDPALSDDLEDRLRECFEQALGRFADEDTAASSERGDAEDAVDGAKGKDADNPAGKADIRGD
jgi:hypothetical protein